MMFGKSTLGHNILPVIVTYDDFHNLILTPPHISRFLIHNSPAADQNEVE